jgi:hypothetical protein
MLIKLTNYGSNRPTLVNLDKAESVYQVYDRTKKRMSTKICFSGNNSFINVEEDLQTIMKLQQEAMEGEFQDTEWITPTIEERIESSYQEHRNYRPRMERSYNQYDENRY